MNKNILGRYGQYLLMFGFGLTLTMISPLISRMIEEFSLNLTQGGMINSVMGAGGMIGVILLLFVSDHVKKNLLLVFSFMLFVFSMAAISFAPGYTIVIMPHADYGHRQ